MAEESGEAKVAAHGILMIIGFLFLSQAAETIAIYASSKVGGWVGLGRVGGWGLLGYVGWALI